MNKKLDVIIDTDPGHDDALAIMLAIKSEKLKIHAITTVAGNSTIENTTRNAMFVLKLLKRHDIPVFPGSSKPLKRRLKTAVVHGKGGLQGLDTKLHIKLQKNAVEKILSIVDMNKGKVVLITLGPLTNIAKAIKRSPSIMKGVKEIYMMGGAINVGGNQSSVAEFNIFTDPEAADVVFRFPVKKTLIPLDACNNIVMSLEDFECLKGSELYTPIVRMLKPYIRNIHSHLGIKDALMYDPLAVYSVIKPSAIKTENMYLAVETDSNMTSGMVVKRGGCYADNFTKIRVVTAISEKSFKSYFIKCLKAGPTK